MSSLIIGVIGGTRNAGKEALEWAPEVGRLVGERGSILLTGGEPIVENSVKAKTMCAARDAGTLHSPTGIVGIIPSRPDGFVGVVLDERNPTSYGLYLYTGVHSYERNVLTGILPDVLIVLAGGEGTLSEAAYAIDAHRPLLFLGSRDLLRQSLVSLKGNVIRIIDKLDEVCYRSHDMVESLSHVLQGTNASYPALDCSSPADAIGGLSSFSLTGLNTSERYPDLRKHPLQNFKNEFEDKLDKLERLIQNKAPNQAAPSDQKAPLPGR
jgi:SLOG cluster4 family